MSDHVETEIKLRVGSVESARELLAGIGAALVRPRYFEDNVLLDDEARSLQAGRRVLRVRRTPEGGVVTYKAPIGNKEGAKRRQEVEAAVPDPATLESILRNLGFEPTFRYQKFRETYGWEGAEIVIDETPIGTFLEIEGELAQIHEAAQALGFTREDYMTDTYVDLFFAGGGQGDMVF